MLLTFALLHYCLISQDICSDRGKRKLKSPPLFSPHLQEFFSCGPTTVENLISSRKLWEEKTSRKENHGMQWGSTVRAPSLTSDQEAAPRLAAGSPQLNLVRYTQYKACLLQEQS